MKTPPSPPFPLRHFDHIPKKQKETMISSWLPLRVRQAAGLLPAPYRPTHPQGTKWDRKAFSSDLFFWLCQGPKTPVFPNIAARPGIESFSNGVQSYPAVIRFSIYPAVIHFSRNFGFPPEGYRFFRSSPFSLLPFLLSPPSLYRSAPRKRSPRPGDTPPNRGHRRNLAF